MHRVKFNDYAELLSDDLNNNNAYLYNGLVTTIADFIAANDCVSGLEVTAQAVPDMTVYVKAGRIYQDGYQGFLEADLTTPLTIAPASASQPRIDLICAKYEEVEDEPEIRNVLTDVVSRNVTQIEVKTRIASSIAFQVVGGTAAAEPTVPTTPEGWVALAKVTVPANTSVIQQSNIVDMRPKIINIYQHDHSGGANGTKLDYNNLENLPDLSAFKGATTEAAGTKGMVPAPAKGNNNRYLKSDGTWGEIDTMQGATSSAAGKSGLVPVPTAGENNRYLSADGTWKTISGMKGATSSAAGTAGLVPAPAAGEDDEFLRGDGTWQPISNMKGASSNAAGASGLVPAPAAGDQGKALLGDGTWELLVKAIAEASGTITVTKSDGSTATIKQILKAIQDGNGNNIVNTYATKTDLNAKAPLASPTFTGTPKSTTPASNDNSTRIATTAFVKALVGAANNGGIVSANLAQNGYVKFANGFILQWGYVAATNSTQTNKTVTYPLAVTSTLLLLRTNRSNVDVGAFLKFLGYISKSAAGFTCNIQGTDRVDGFDWLAICKA